MSYHKYKFSNRKYKKPLVTKTQIKQVGTVMMDPYGVFFIVFKVTPTQIFTRVLGELPEHYLRVFIYDLDKDYSHLIVSSLVDNMRFQYRTLKTIIMAFWYRLLWNI